MQFNESQQQAIAHKQGPMLVLAGPGSGKTAVLVARTKNLIRCHGVSPSEILVITFTKAAAKEMEARFRKEMPGVKVSFGTFHAVFFTVLKAAYRYEASQIVTEEVRHRVMRECIGKFGLDYRDEGELIQGLLAEISLIKNSGIVLEHFYSTQCGEEVFRKIYKVYDSFLKEHRLLDFDDMLTMTRQLFAERPDILSAWQKKYRYILIDEFQDINRIQYEVIRMMAAPENNLFMVGDDDQSIYRFRGSKPEIMLHVPADYPTLKQVHLDTNYRCQKAVIDASLRLISHNTKRFDKQIRGVKKKENDVTFVQLEGQYEEAVYIIKQIQEQLKRGYRLSDIAILFRTNTQPRLLMEQLMAYNLDFRAKDRIPNLYDHWIAKDIRTYMELAKGSRERKDFLMILNKPKRYIERDSLEDILVSFNKWKRRYDSQPWIAERIEKLEADITFLQKLSPYAAVNYIRKGIDYDSYLKEYAKYRNLSEEDLFEILEELQATAKGFRNYEAWELHMKECAEELQEKAKQREENGDAITLATLHSAKGLEYPCVYILDANEGITPYKKALSDMEMEEERRLFYVGMTRAISELTICAVKTMRGKSVEVSRFVKEAGLIKNSD